MGRDSFLKAGDRLTRGKSSTDPVLSYPVILVGWIALLLSSYVHYRLLTGVHQDFLTGLFPFSTCYYPWLLLTPLVFRLERRFPIARPFSLRNLMLLLGLGIPICYGASIGASNTMRLFGRIAGHREAAVPFTVRVGLTEINLQASLVLALLGVSASLRYLADTRDSERKAAELALEKAELEGALREAELETLRMRLNPHFLFNCLQNISSLASEDSKAASTTIARLGDLLRVALSHDYQSHISLRQEIELTRSYLAIEQIRFGDRLSVLFSLDPLAEGVPVPSLLLQPLVENALKHGLAERGQGLVSISSAIEAGMLNLAIRDNGSGAGEERSEAVGFGVGLTATRERLQRMYGEKQSLSIRKLPEGGTEIRLSLPATCVPVFSGVPKRATDARAPRHLPHLSA